MSPPTGIGVVGMAIGWVARVEDWREEARGVVCDKARDCWGTVPMVETPWFTTGLATGTYLVVILGSYPILVTGLYLTTAWYEVFTTGFKTVFTRLPVWYCNGCWKVDTLYKLNIFH